MIALSIQKILDKQDLTDEERLQLVYWFESMQNAPQQLQTLFAGGASRISAVSQITPNLGVMVSGKFIAPLSTATSFIPTEAGFTGSFMSGNGETFNGAVYNIGGVNAGVFQWGASQIDGTLKAGAGGITLSSTGMIFENTSGNLYFKNAAGSIQDGTQIYAAINDDFFIINGGPGKAIKFAAEMADNTRPYIKIWEDPGNANAFQVNVVVATNGSQLGIGSEVVIWGGKDGKETVFNDGSYDIDFRVESATDANALKLDAGSEKLSAFTWFVVDGGTDRRVEIGSDHYIPTRDSPNKTTIFNEANQDMDFNVQGDTDSDLFFVDASTDRVGIGTATPAEKLDVVGNIKASGTITSGAGTGVTPLDGWVASSATWSYSSADSPTFVISINADVTALIGVGDRIKLTQTTAKYFIVTAVGAWSGSATLVTVYGGTDYTLANAAISSPYYSHSKSPLGFSQDPDKWTVSASNTANANKTPPSANTWYGGAGLTNTGISIDVPIGIWKGFYKGVLESTDTTVTDYNIYATLSTANNTESNTNNTFFVALTVPSGTYKIWSVVSPPVTVNVAAKTTYYMNIKTSTSTADSIHMRGDVVPTIVKLVCAYL